MQQIALDRICTFLFTVMQMAGSNVHSITLHVREKKHMTLEHQLTYHELTGNKSKAKLIRSTMNAIKLVKEQEQRDLAKLKKERDEHTV